MCSDSYPIPILSFFFLYHPYIPSFLIQRIFYFLVKSDGCDVVAGLTECMRLEWGGDIDLGDGELQRQHEKYLCRVQLVKGILRNVCDVHQRNLIILDLQMIKESLEEDLLFILTG